MKEMAISAKFIFQRLFNGIKTKKIHLYCFTNLIVIIHTPSETYVPLYQFQKSHPGESRVTDSGLTDPG
jgi:hypothetical protein